MTAITVKNKRRENDFYPTPATETRRLIKQCPFINGAILECCAGAGDISDVLKTIDGSIVLTNDIDPLRDTDFHEDVSTDFGWRFVDQSFDWIVTNPPFNIAPSIVPLAYRYANIGIAMLLRLSFLEPCLNRVDFLSEHPPTKLIVCPRVSFTGDGKTDSVTCAWMIWDKRVSDSSIVIAR